MRRPNHASRFEGIAKTNLQASRASDTETLQSQVNKAAKKRLSLSGLEILHGRLNDWVSFPKNFIGVVFTSCSHVLAKVSSSKSAKWRQRAIWHHRATLESQAGAPPHCLEAVRSRLRAVQVVQVGRYVHSNRLLVAKHVHVQG